MVLLPDAGAVPGQPPSALSRLRSSGVVCTNRPPLYFQHEGHSRTIIGIERRQQSGQAAPSYSLLLLDPGCPSRELEAALRWACCERCWVHSGLCCRVVWAC